MENHFIQANTELMGFTFTTAAFLRTLNTEAKKITLTLGEFIC